MPQMWPWNKKTSTGKLPEAPRLPLEELLDLKARVRASEREIEALSDFVRRLAGRRAKEKPTNGHERNPGDGLDTADEPVGAGSSGAGLPAAKRALWSRVQGVKRELGQKSQTND